MEDLLTILRKEKIKLEGQLQEAYQDRSLAGPNDEDTYDLKIKNLRSKIEKLSNEITEEKKKLQTPESVKIFCYVLVSTRDKIKKNIGEKSFSLFEAERYHKQEPKQWRPFKGNPTIATLIEFIRTFYNFTPIYIDTITNDKKKLDQLLIALDDEILNSISIIDLFSIDRINEDVARKFDTKKAGVILPLCRTLNSELTDIAIDVQRMFKTLKANMDGAIPCTNYAFDISTADRFKQDLLRIFKQKFPITNQSASDNPVRGLNIGLQ